MTYGKLQDFIKSKKTISFSSQSDWCSYIKNALKTKNRCQKHKEIVKKKKIVTNEREYQSPQQGQGYSDQEIMLA